jgi:hypothetical protein
MGLAGQSPQSPGDKLRQVIAGAFRAFGSLVVETTWLNGAPSGVIGTVTADEAIITFTPEKVDNHACVGAIKVAMTTYGQSPSQVFRTVAQTPDGGFDVTMRDGTTVHLTRAEIALASEKSGFVSTPNTPMMRDATFIYAAMAKRAQVEANASLEHDHSGFSMTYSMALDTIGMAEVAKKCFQWLGLPTQSLEGKAAEDYLKSRVADPSGPYRPGVMVIEEPDGSLDFIFFGESDKDRRAAIEKLSFLKPGTKVREVILIATDEETEQSRRDAWEQLQVKLAQLNVAYG